MIMELPTFGGWVGSPEPAPAGQASVPSELLTAIARPFEANTPGENGATENWEAAEDTPLLVTITFTLAVAPAGTSSQGTCTLSCELTLFAGLSGWTKRTGASIVV